MPIPRRSALFDVQLQTGQGIVPPARDDLEAPATLREPLGVERPDMLAALTTPINEPGGGKDVKVLSHALPRHRPESLREHRDRSRTTIRQPLQQGQPRRVAERREQQRGARQTPFNALTPGHVVVQLFSCASPAASRAVSGVADETIAPCWLASPRWRPRYRSRTDARLKPSRCNIPPGRRVTCGLSNLRSLASSSGLRGPAKHRRREGGRRAVVTPLDMPVDAVRVSASPGWPVHETAAWSSCRGRWT